MPSANHLRTQIEATLANRFPAALTPSPAGVRDVMRLGIDQVDKVMQGGVPCGAITELVGTACSGRTSLGLAYAASIIRTGSVCAWVDGSDALCPEDAAANGVDLDYLLWVRCGSFQHRAARTPVPVGQSRASAATVSSAQPRHTGGGSPHPRSEADGMPQAISVMLKAHGGLLDKQIRREKRSIGTPGQPNRPVTGRPSEREEQVNSDRRPPRRGENLALEPRCAEPQPRRVANVPSGERLPVHPMSAMSIGGAQGTSWQAIDQALRATDLLLQGGGFSAIVLDLSGVPPEMAWRIPLATWFRFRAACERTRTSLLLLTQHACARSSAELVLKLQSGGMEAQGHVMTGIHYSAVLERSRSNESAPRVIPIRKPPQSERPGEWTSKAAWRI
jgi:recombination protein RecA